MSKNILFLALNYPDTEYDSNMYTDLMQEFKKHGHQVYVVASSSETGKTGLFNEGGIHVLRCKTYSYKTQNLINKGIANVLLPYQYLQAIKSKLSSIEFNLVILPTPPITLLSVIKKLKQKKDIPVYLILRDIFPQNAVDIKLMRKNMPLYFYFRNIEKKLYKEVDKIGCMSLGNIDYIQSNNEIESSKIELLRNWQTTQFNEEIDKEKLKINLGLEGKFVIFYGGNISKPQKINNAVKLIKEYRNEDELIFYFIGRGTEIKEFSKEIKRNKFKNVIVEESIARKKYLELLNIADVGLVTLDENFTIPNMPSKTISYLFAGVPILALIDKTTDFGPWIQNEVEAGYWVEATNTKESKEKLDTLIKSKKLRLKIGAKGKKYAHKFLTPNVAYKTIIKEST